jgi:Fe-Mn family superoxide dismutase
VAFELPPLPYAYDALERAIDAETMHVHHDKHHAAYTNNFNAAIADYPDLQAKTAEDILRTLDQVPEAIRTAVRNHGGGHVNHVMFWESMSPEGGGEPTGPIADAIARDFGSFANLKEQFNDAGMKRFGSGWVWLVKDGGSLRILSTANQDSPLSDGLTPILMNDVWEHAYYLRYRNLRADYLKAWWDVVNWDVANKRFAG